jgi:tripartite-type tricarboxylate transporter receptor subunit TctC
MIRISMALLLAIGVSGLSSPAVAQTDAWPTRAVRVVVAFPPGGATDVIGRIVAQGLSTELGQNVIVENRAGASGIIGSDSVAKSTADG